jgi:hypothetical protein
MILLDIPVSSPSVSLPYKLESDDVASSLFLFTKSTVPNASVLFDILYLGFIALSELPYVQKR